MVRTRLQQLAPYSLNAARIGQLRGDNPDKRLLYALADGMRVSLPTEFTLNGKEPTAKLRGTYMKVYQAVNCMLGDVVIQRLAFLLPKTVAIDIIPNFHLCAAHWTPKKGKARRPIGDLWYISETPLNTDETTPVSAAFYGEIRHPTIDAVAKRLINFGPERRRKMSLRDKFSM